MDNTLRHTGEQAPLNQDLTRAGRAPDTPTDAKVTHEGYEVRSDVRRFVPISNEEIALLRAFLAVEINAILDSEDDGR